VSGRPSRSWPVVTNARVDSTHLAPGINPVQGMFIEMFGTSFLVLSILMLAVEKHQATPFAPVSLCYRWTALFVTDGRTILGRDRPYSLRLPNVRGFASISHPEQRSLIDSSWTIYYTGGAVNTARAFGPAVVTGFPYGTQWVVRIPSFTPPPTLTSLLSTGLARAWGRFLGQGFT
jgi:aquaporin related protein